MKWKFVALITIVVLLISSAQNIVFYQLDKAVLTESLQSRVSTLARVLADNSTSAVQFRSTGDAAEVLGSLSREPAIREAYLFSRDERVLAEYVAAEEERSLPPPTGSDATTTLLDDLLIVQEPVILNGEQIGLLRLSADFRELQARAKFRAVFWTGVLIAAVVLAVLIAFWSQRFFVDPILQLAQLTKSVGIDKQFSLRAERTSNDEVGTLVDSFNSMLDAIEERDHEIVMQSKALRRSNAELTEARNTLETRVEERTRELQASERRFRALLESAPDAILISTEGGIIEFVNAQAGKLFGYAQGALVGQPIGKLFPDQVEDDRIAAGKSFLACPEPRAMGIDDSMEAVRSDGKRIPVEVNLSPIQTDWGVRVAAAVRDVTERREQNERLLETMEELTQTNQDLEQTSQELEAQQEELQQTNAELEEQRSALEEEKQKLEGLTEELKLSHSALSEKAREANLANQYKSEFLANMSHELRTPLNSIMILSQVLNENARGNLDKEQVKHAETIYGSGKDLLELINDILDLSRIESGKLELDVEEFEISDLVDNLERTFAAQMDKKSLRFEVTTGPRTPRRIWSDRGRLEQIIRNLVSNAMKFTEHGTVTLEFGTTEVRNGRSVITISVGDSGIGIPADKLQLIFEAFTQVDSSLSRRYGGTGLGLSISLNLARALGGGIAVESVEGEGSTFTLHLPIDGNRDLAAPAMPELPSAASDHSDHRALPVGESARTILIIEDDTAFADSVMTRCNDRGYRCKHVTDGQSGVAWAIAHQPLAIVLDLRLPGMSGIGVLECLKKEPNTRNIPIHAMSIENHEAEALRLGAANFRQKPISLDDLDATIEAIEKRTDRKAKSVLLVEDDPAQCSAIRRLMEDASIELSSVHSVDDAVTSLRSNRYDCVILDLKLNGRDGLDVLRSFDGEAAERPPVVVYTAKELSQAELCELAEYTDAVVVKGQESQARLLDEVTLFLHSIEARQQRASRPSPAKGAALADGALVGKRVLIVDDDVRNIYSLRHVLRSRGMETIEAHTGIEALAALDEERSFDIVLMDIMMPEMNGIDAIKAIREKARFSDLPVIALTAKAMKFDRDACLHAGANDYLSKPLEIDALLSLMRVWLTS